MLVAFEKKKSRNRELECRFSKKVAKTPTLLLTSVLSCRLHDV